MPDWPCLNPVCKHYLKPAILQVQITRCTKTSRPLGQFACEHCGFTYTRRGPDGSETDRLELLSIRTIGSLWNKKAIEIANANYMNVSGQETQCWMYKVVIENLSDLPHWYKGQNIVRPINRYRKKISEFQKAEKRSLWLQHIKDNPSLNKSELRATKEDIYRWLSNYDRDWFNENSPHKKSMSANSFRTDWIKKI